MRLQVFFLDNFQHLQADRTRNVVPAKRAEEFHAVIKRAGDRLCGNHCADRMSVANGLAQHDDVRSYAVLLECIEVSAGPAVACLYFIGNTNSSGGAYSVVYLRQVTFG